MSDSHPPYAGPDDPPTGDIFGRNRVLYIPDEDPAAARGGLHIPMEVRYPPQPPEGTTWMSP